MIKHILILILLTCLMTTGMTQQLAKTNETSDLQFEQTTFNYGDIQEGEKVQTIFKFVNTGDEPLTITAAKGSCGCTVPSWPKEPIAPGATGEFVVRFDSKGKAGFQAKRVTITANTDPVNTYLTLKGQVIASKKETITKVNEKEILEIYSDNIDVDRANVSLFPNPTSDILKVEMKDMDGKAAKLSIYDFSGQLVTTKQVKQLSNEVIDFDVSSFVAGTYTLSIKVDEMNRIARQFTIQ